MVFSVSMQNRMEKWSRGPCVKWETITSIICNMWTNWIFIEIILPSLWYSDSRNIHTCYPGICLTWIQFSNNLVASQNIPEFPQQLHILRKISQIFIYFFQIWIFHLFKFNGSCNMTFNGQKVFRLFSRCQRCTERKILRATLNKDWQNTTPNIYFSKIIHNFN